MFRWLRSRPAPDAAGARPSGSDAVDSPCNAVCALDARGVCIGCGRSGDEIARWTSLSDDARRAVIAAAAERRARRGAS